MKYYYDYDNRTFLTLDELKAEYAEYFAKGYTEAETFEDYLYNCLDYSMMEITEKIYNEREQADAVRSAIKNHIASYHASWNVEVSDDGDAWKLTLEGDPVCGIELRNVIPALDYLYGIISFDSTEEEDMEAMTNMVAEWGL